MEEDSQSVESAAPQPKDLVILTPKALPNAPAKEEPPKVASFKVNPGDLGRVSEWFLPFEDEDFANGIDIAVNSPSERIWTLISSFGNVKHPYYASDDVVLERVMRQAIVAHDDELQLNSEFCVLYDIVEDAKEGNAILKGTMTFEEETRICLEATDIFTNWTRTRKRAEALASFYEILQQRRVERLREALSLCRDARAYVKRIKRDFKATFWAPSKKVEMSMFEQMQDLKYALVLSNFNIMQTCTAALTGRPLFTPAEYSKNKPLVLELGDEVPSQADESYGAPLGEYGPDGEPYKITGSVRDRFKLANRIIATGVKPQLWDFTEDVKPNQTESDGESDGESEESR